MDSAEGEFSAGMKVKKQSLAYTSEGIVLSKVLEVD